MAPERRQLEISLYSSRSVISYLRCQTLHNSLERRREWPAASWRRTRIRLPPPETDERENWLQSAVTLVTLPGELGISSRSRACVETWPPPQRRMWNWPLCRSPPSPWCPCPGPTRAGRRAGPGRGRRWVAWYAWSAPCSGGRGWGRRGSRRSSRPQWRPRADSWNSRWMSSTAWYCIAAYLTQFIFYMPENIKLPLTFVVESINSVDGCTLMVAT